MKHDDQYPPRSSYDLLQEKFYDDEWKLLVACIFCNLTRRVQAEPILHRLLEIYPSPTKMMSASPEDLEQFFRPLGMWRKRANTLIRMSKEFVEKDWTEPDELYGIGKYASDAWHIFCKGDWRNVLPKDHALNDYHNFLKERYGEK